MKLRSAGNKGFTLVEVLVVIGITGVTAGLILYPLIRGFSLTRQSQVLMRGQQNAQRAMDAIALDLRNAMYIYDNSGNAMKFPVRMQDGTPTIVDPDTPANDDTPVAYYSRIDLVLPRSMAYCTSPDHPSDKPREFPRGFHLDSAGNIVNEEDESYIEGEPTCPYDKTSLELRPSQPLTPDTKIVRYFVGLRDPSKAYANMYDKRIEGGKGNNPYVLYRAEFNIQDEDLIPYLDGKPANEQPVSVDLASPLFFYDKRNNQSGTGSVSAAWKKISKPVVTPHDGTDLLVVDFDSTGNAQVTPTIRFAPTPIYDDPLKPVSGSSSDKEHGTVPPVAYRATYGHWTLPYEVTLRRRIDIKDPDTGSITHTRTIVYQTVKEVFADDPLKTTHPEYVDHDGHMVIKVLSDTEDSSTNVRNGLIAFDITQYQADRDASRYGAGLPVSYYNDDQSWAPSPLPENTTMDAPPELAFSVDYNRGLVDCAFLNVDTQASQDLSDLLHYDIGVSCRIPTDSVNEYFAATEGKPEDHYRMWEIHHPLDRVWTVTGHTGGSWEQQLARRVLGGVPQPITAGFPAMSSSIVPGMEQVYGPYQGGSSMLTDKLVLYERTPMWEMLAQPGANQYKLDISHPVRDENGSIIVDGAGYSTYPGTAALYFNSAPTTAGALPAGKYIYVRWYEQNNLPGDSLTATYTTKNVITVTVGMRMYDSTSGRPQTVQLPPTKVVVKNVQE